MIASRCSSSTWDAEICVLGGGPAGALVARNLAELGHDVVVVESGIRGAPARGESIPSSSGPFLHSIGLGAIVDAATYQHEDDALLLWHSDRVETRKAGSGGVLIDRGRLDPFMRQTARDAGARLLMPARAQASKRLAGGGWQVRLVARAGPGSLTARFLVDARGRRRRIASGPHTIAICGRWRRVGPQFRQTRIEAGGGEWFWGSPQPQGCYGAAVFLDADRVRGLGHSERTALYRNLVGGSRLLGALTEGELTGRLELRDATTATAPEPIGADFIHVGDAAVAIDPLSSQGLQAAFRSAVHGCAAVHTLLTGTPDPSEPIEFYRKAQRRLAAQSGLAAARLYAAAEGDDGKQFWIRRSAGVEQTAAADLPATPPATLSEDRLSVSDQVRIVEVPVLAGARIARAPALSHPGLAEPTAFFGGIALAPLVAEVDAAMPASEIVQLWMTHAPAATGRAILSWMYAMGILVSS